MRLELALTGAAPILFHNGAAGLDTGSPLSREIAALAAKKAGDRAPLSKSSGSKSSGVNGPSISTMTASPRYRKQRFGR